jgi:hypothetical protein
MALPPHQQVFGWQKSPNCTGKGPACVAQSDATEQVRS